MSGKSTRRSLLKKIGVSSLAIPTSMGLASGDSRKPPEELFNEHNEYYLTEGTEQNENDPINYSIKVTSGQESANSSPITLEISITNTTDSQVSIADEQSSFFYGAMSEDQSFVLIPVKESEEYISNMDGCWVLDKGYFDTEMYNRLRLDPDETKSRELYLIHTGASIAKTCLDYPSKIQFDPTESYIYQTTESKTSVTWGFTLKESSLWDQLPDWHPPRYTEITGNDEDNSSEETETETPR